MNDKAESTAAKLDWRESFEARQYGLSREQMLAKIVDELIVLMRPDIDYHIVRLGMSMIAEIANENPGHPITAGLATHMRDLGLLEEEVCPKCAQIEEGQCYDCSRGIRG